MDSAMRAMVLLGGGVALAACGGLDEPPLAEDTPGVLQTPSVATTTRLGFAQIDMGLATGCGVTPDAAVYCWGSNQELQLGSPGPFQRCNKTDCSDTPLRVTGLPDASAVAVGARHACALARTGETWCWGRGTYGELGRAVAEDSLRPVQVQTAERFVQLAAGAFSCGRTAEGDIYCWGAGGNAGVGSGSGGHALLPVRIASNLAFRQVAVGDYSACAVTDTGAVYCWGANAEGQLGLGDLAAASVPTLVGGALSGLAVSDIDLSGSHACALAAGRAYCWGRKIATGDPDADNPQWSPVAVRSDQSFGMISAGTGYSCALTADDESWCWGENDFYTLGDGTATDRRTPVRSKTSARFRQVSTGFGVACGLTAPGTPYCWGFNVYGEALRPSRY
jgi:alpha-tubulin suppressor-like RCC1 family protein